jgi:hypothetical protein
MKERLRLALDSRVVAEVRAMATERGMSLSQFVEEHLLRVVRNRRSFTSAKRRALERLRVGLDLRWTPSRSREDVHQR